MFCTLCQTIFRDTSELESEVEVELSQHHRPEDLQAAASAGCYICDSVWRRYLFRKAASPASSSTSSASQATEVDRSEFCRYFIAPLEDSEDVVEFCVIINLYFDAGEKFDDIGVGSSYVTFYLRPISSKAASYFSLDSGRCF